jgi:hypothetical protein
MGHGRHLKGRRSLEEHTFDRIHKVWESKADTALAGMHTMVDLRASVSAVGYCARRGGLISCGSVALDGLGEILRDDSVHK